MSSTRSNFAAVLSDSESVKHKALTEFSSYETPLSHNSARIDTSATAAFQDRVLAAASIQKAQESRATGNEMVEGAKGMMK